MFDVRFDVSGFDVGWSGESLCIVLRIERHATNFLYELKLTNTSWMRSE